MHEQHVAPLPSLPTSVHRLYTDHSSGSSESIIDPTDGMTCHECHNIPDTMPKPLTYRATAVTEPDCPPEEDCAEDSSFPVEQYLVCSLSRSALRMLGHLDFRRLSTMHDFVKGMPEFSIPNALEDCPVCLAAKLRKQPSGTATTMHSTVCNQGISIDFGFMVQRSRNKKRQHNLVGLNGETCYALITNHFSGRLYGRAFASKTPPVEWINKWLANNAPNFPGKYVRMDGGGELGKSRDIHQTFNNFGYTVELTGPD